MQSEKTEKLKCEIAIATWNLTKIIFESVKDGENTGLEIDKCYAFFKRGQVRSQGISQCNANIVKYTKQIVGQQIYRHLEDVKVIKTRKPQKSMETNVHPNERPMSLLFSCKDSEWQEDRHRFKFWNYNTICYSLFMFKAVSTVGCILVSQISATVELPCL